MPNHISNILAVSGNKASVKVVFDFIRGDGDQLFDFNKVIPMPEDLNIDSCSLGEWGLRYVRDNDREAAAHLDTLTPEDRAKAISLGQRYLYNIERFGHTTWYDWCRANWGTKWNAYYFNEEVEGEDDQIQFSTAWSAPIPVIEKLSAMFPDLDFELTYADEDMGYNTGQIEFNNGEAITSYFPTGGSDEAMELYFKTHPSSEGYIKKGKDGVWRSID